MTALSSKVTIYVPSTVSVKTKANTTAWSNRIAKYLSANFGGATSTKASGYWVSDSGELIKENVTLVYAYCTSKDLSLKKNDIFALAQEMKESLSQEAVSVELDNTLYLV